MQRHRLIGTALCSGVVALWVSHAGAEEFSARLTGFQEIGGLGAGETGAILSAGTGTFELNLDRQHSMASYKLAYTSGLSSAITQAHIHFGKFHVAGGIFVWLCGTASNPGPVGTPKCVGPGATLTGTITPGNIVSPGTGTPPSNQGIVAGDFDALEDALTSNTAYANIHTASFPAGEIRGQIHRGDLDEKHDNHDSHDHH
jgi:hypothetical protein